MSEVVDYAFTTVNERALAAAGKVAAGRYVGPGSAAKHLTRDEVARLHAAGLSIWLNVEGAAGDAAAGWSLGISHAGQAENARIALGAPAVPLYFAVDFDVSPGQWPSVRQYLRGAATVVGFRRVGVYGGVNAVTWADRDACAAWFFQTYAWSGGRWFPGNHLEQYHNGVALAGGTVDLGRAKQANYGQWAPAGTPTPAEDDMLKFVRVSDGSTPGAVWLTNGVSRYHIPDPGAYAIALKTWGQTTSDVVSIREAELPAYGADISATGPGGSGPSTGQIADAVVDEMHNRLAN